MSAFHESARKIIQNEIPTVRKSIMIGLGGSGMRGIASARQYIEKHMPAEARPYMRWVGVDTTDIGTSIEGQGDQYRFPGENQHYQEERRTLYVASPTPAELSTEYYASCAKTKPMPGFRIRTFIPSPPAPDRARTRPVPSGDWPSFTTIRIFAGP